MKKLDKENIDFIDNYLKKMDVSYLDIRMEMTDHIASEIEAKIQNGDQRGFYAIFKEYMLKNKRDLSKNYKKFRNNMAKKMMLRVFHNLYNHKTLLFMIPVFMGVYTFLDFFTSYWTTVHTIFTWAVLLFYFLPSYFFEKRKVSYLHMIMICFLVVNYTAINMFLHKDFSPNFIFWYASISIWLNAAVFKTLLGLKARYKGNFQFS